MYTVQRVDEKILLDLEGKSHTVFTSYKWIQFLVRNQAIEPVVLAICDQTTVVAYFVGGIIRKFGVRILGSPFNGWLTCDMGFIRIGAFSIEDALQAVKRYGLNELNCLYIQIIDKNIRREDLNSSIPYDLEKMVYLNLDRELIDIFNSFSKEARRNIKYFEKREAIPSQVCFDDTFAKDYYSQLIMVFAKQNLNPSYGLNKIQDLVSIFKDDSHIFACKAANTNGDSIASIFTFGGEEWAYFMGAASNNSDYKLYPNEGLFWEFIKYWHDKGIKNVDMVGFREYKLKYNPSIVDVPVIYFQKIPFIHFFKSVAYKVYMARQRFIGLFRK